MSRGWIVNIPRTSFSVAVAFIGLTILSGSRLWLYIERRADLADLSLAKSLELFWVGFRLDAMIVGQAMLPLLAVLLLARTRWLSRIRPFVRGYAAILFLVLFFAEVCGYYFFQYFNFRLNYLVLEHGADPEMLRVYLQDYPLPWFAIVTLGGATICMLLLRRLAPLQPRPPSAGGSRSLNLRDRPGMVLLLLLVTLGARGTLDHRPLNVSAAAVTSNRLANEIASSGILNVAYELEQRIRHKYVAVESVIETLPMAEARERARRYVAAAGALTDDSSNPLVRQIAGREPARPLNVVLVVMESFTARLVGTLGGSPALTPEFDGLADQGVLFENCYATGGRTIQGLEAPVSSFPPIPGVSVVRRPQARYNFTTLGTMLKDRGYETLFIYGGQGIFDQMRGFFLSNGFDNFIEEKDFENVIFHGSWGVSDEDIFRRADQEFRRRWEKKQPFFATILTVSLHSPWQYPEGRIAPLPRDIEVPSGFRYEELNNYLYADYAIGKFIRDARKAPYFDDTLFVFVGDHGVHFGHHLLVPVDDYRVAALFLAPKYLEPERIRRVASQLDVGPTIMGILGGDYRSTLFGRDILTNKKGEGFAILVYKKREYGFINGSDLTLLTVAGEKLSYVRNHETGVWEESPFTRRHRETANRGVALLQIGQDLLLEGNYNTARTDEHPSEPVASRRLR